MPELKDVAPISEVRGSDADRVRPAFAVALLLLSLTVGVALTEVCYRLTRRVVCTGASNVNVYRRDPDYGWAHEPNSGGWYYGCVGRKFEWRAETRINTLGLRDREHSYAKAPGTTRVLLLGDSITEAVQVPLEQTFAALLGGNMRARGAPVEVINTGTAVYSTDNELAFFRAEGVRYAPDVVVLVFNASNDILENSRALHERLYTIAGGRIIVKRYSHVEADGRLVRDAEEFPAQEPRSRWERVQDHVFLLRALGRLIAPTDPAETAASTARAAAFMQEVTNTTPDPEWAEAWRLTETLLLALRRQVEQSGATFGVAIMPSQKAIQPAGPPVPADASHDPDYPVNRIAGFLEREGIAHVSLAPALRDSVERTGVKPFFLWDVHLTPAGHAVVADALAPFVADLVRARAH